MTELFFFLIGLAGGCLIGRVNASKGEADKKKPEERVTFPQVPAYWRRQGRKA